MFVYDEMQRTGRVRDPSGSYARTAAATGGAELEWSAVIGSYNAGVCCTLLVDVLGQIS
jgi:hypothetical protein